jgi:hypothetical protein
MYNHSGLVMYSLSESAIFDDHLATIQERNTWPTILHVSGPPWTVHGSPPFSYTS